MASITGRSAIIAYEPSASTWGTAVAPGALDGLICRQCGPLVPVAEMHPDDAAGYQWHENIRKGRITANPTIIMPARYSGRQWSFVAQCMGLDTKTGEADPYTHSMTLLDAIDGSDNFGSLAAELGGSLIHEWPSVKPTGFTLEGPDDQGYMELTVRTIADNILLAGDATTASGDFDAVTHMQISSLLAKRIAFGALQFRMNMIADALDADDKVSISHINLTFDRQFGPEWVNRAALADQFKTDEPIESGNPVLTLSVTINDYNALTYPEAFQDETTMKADLTWALDANHDLVIELPLMKFMPFEPVISGPERIPQELLFQMMKASAAPTGMTTTTMLLKLKDPETNAYE